MDKYFAYKGDKGLTEAKLKKIDNVKFHLGSVDIAFNNNDTYEMIR